MKQVMNLGYTNSF